MIKEISNFESLYTITGISKKYNYLIKKVSTKKEILKENISNTSENMQLVVVKDRSLLNLPYVAAVKKTFFVTIKSLIACLALTIANMFI